MLKDEEYMKKSELVRTIRVMDVNGMLHTEYLNGLDQYEITPSILRIEFEGGRTIEYMRSNIVYVDFMTI
jgi:hypothetical protein